MRARMAARASPPQEEIALSTSASIERLAREGLGDFLRHEFTRTITFDARKGVVVGLGFSRNFVWLVLIMFSERETSTTDPEQIRCASNFVTSLFSYRLPQACFQRPGNQRHMPRMRAATSTLGPWLGARPGAS